MGVYENSQEVVAAAPGHNIASGSKPACLRTKFNLSDTDRIFSCVYCKAKLLVFGYPYCSDYLKPSAGAPKDLYYVPYWRFKGTHWILNTKGIHHTLVDQSVCAASFPYVQQTLDIQISPGYEPGDIHIPFWRFDVIARQIPLETYGDLVRLTNLPRAIFPGMESQKLFLWIPAFKSNPALFFRLGKLMTINQKPENYATTLPAADYYPVTLSVEEGFKAISIVLGDIGLSRKALLPLLEENSFDLMSSTLVYVPFTHARGEFIQKSLNFALQSNALKWGRFL